MSQRASIFSHTCSALLAVGLVGLVVSGLSGQVAGTPLTLLSREGRRTMPVTVLDNQEFVALDDLAAAFQLAVREESGAITVSYRGRTIVLTPEQALSSVAGRLISLPAPPARSGGRWVVPIEFISRVLASVYDTRLDLRRASHLLVIGDLRVPRVTIRYETFSAGARLTIDAAPRTASTVAQDNNQVTIKFDADVLDVAIPAIQPQGLVQGIRTIDAVTLALDLGPRFSALRASTQTLDAATRLVIDLVSSQTEAAAPAPITPPPPPVDLPILGQALPAIRTIAIDPGHGGDDLGARDAEGRTEKDLTLAVARRLKGAIEGRLGIRVLLTREDDRGVAIDERAAMANNNKADLFISLHANASLRAEPSGASIYVAAFSDADLARVAGTPERVPTFGGGLRDIELVLWDLAQIRHVDRSAELARMLEQQFQNRVPLDAPPLGRAPFRVLESANMPAVLIEMGYLTNADQEQQLAGNEFQTAFTQAVFDAVVQFRDYLTAAGADR